MKQGRARNTLRETWSVEVLSHHAYHGIMSRRRSIAPHKETYDGNPRYPCDVRRIARSSGRRRGCTTGAGFWALLLATGAVGYAPREASGRHIDSRRDGRT